MKLWRDFPRLGQPKLKYPELALANSQFVFKIKLAKMQFLDYYNTQI